MRPAGRSLPTPGLQSNSTESSFPANQAKPVPLTVILLDSSRRDGVVVRATALQSIDLGFIHAKSSHAKRL